MSLKGPNKEDVARINAEITQIENQRFQITTLAITLFGVIGAWLIPKNIPPTGPNLDAFTFIGSILLLLLLLLLCFYAHILKGRIRILTAYLIVTNSSNWVYDWQRLDKDNYLGYTFSIAFVFGVLGILSTVIPVILAIAYNLNFASQSWFRVNYVALVLYIIIVEIMGFMDNETKAEERWKKL